MIKVKYADASKWDVFCAVVRCRNPSYGRWYDKAPDPGQAPHTAAELKANAEFVEQMRGVFHKYRGLHRTRYAFEPIQRLVTVLDIVLLALVYKESLLQSLLLTVWTAGQTAFVAYTSPYNSFQRNVNLVAITAIRSIVFALSLLTKIVSSRDSTSGSGSGSADSVAGSFSDMVGPAMIACALAMVGINILLQLK